MEALLDPEVRSRLARYSYLPARVIAYVSSSAGVAINYITRSEQTSVEGWSGARRADCFLFSVPDELCGKLLGGISGDFPGGLVVQNSRFKDVVPVTVSDETEAILVNVWSENGPFSAHVEYAELYGPTRASRWTERQARTRALQEVKTALADVWRSQEFSLPLTEIIRRRKEKTVLVLGSFKESGRERINRIRQYLVNHGYLPVLVDEYPDIEDQSLAQKVTMIGLASRFVIVEDSEAAGQLYEIARVCEGNDLLTIILREQGQQASFMTRGTSVTSKVISEYDYDPSALYNTLDRAVAWAEQSLPQLKEAYGLTYPWRDPEKQAGG